MGSVGRLDGDSWGVPVCGLVDEIAVTVTVWRVWGGWTVTVGAACVWSSGRDSGYSDGVGRLDGDSWGCLCVV